LFILEFVVPINLEVVGGTMGTSQKWATGFLFSWHKYKDFSFHLPYIFLTPQKFSILFLILPPKILVNKNQILKNFDFHLPKFPDIEKHVFSIVYFSLGGM
jgi:hypothetical protein